MKDHWERWGWIATALVVIGFFLWIMIGSEGLLSNMGALVFLALAMIGAVGCLGLLRFSSSAGKTHFDYMQVVMTVLMTVATASSTYVSYRTMQDTNDRRAEDQRPVIRFNWDRQKLAVEMINAGKGDAIIRGIDYFVDDDFLTLTRFPYSDEDVEVMGPIVRRATEKLLRTKELNAVKNSFPTLKASTYGDLPRANEIVPANSRRSIFGWVLREGNQTSLESLVFSDWGSQFGRISNVDLRICYCAVNGNECFISGINSSGNVRVEHCLANAMEGRVILGPSNPPPY